MPSAQRRGEKISQLTRFLTDDIWRIRGDTLTARKSFWITPLRIAVLATRRFFSDNCALRASSLTFYSLLSVVPVVALAFGVAKGFGLEKVMQAKIVDQFGDQPDVAERIVGFARALLENTKGSAIAGVGVVVLFWTVIRLLATIERSFNDIWEIKNDRPLGRKLADYLSAMLIAPVLFIAAGSLTVLLTTRITSMVESLSFLGYAGSVLVFLLSLTPYAVVWILFTFIFAFMPNTKVELRSAIWGGIVAGTVYELAQFAYIKFQLGASSYGPIYGSFAALPLFLVWLQVSWVIVLFGAEISFAHQNVTSFEFEADCSRISHSFRRIVAILVTRHCVKSFTNEEDAPNAAIISRAIGVPLRLTRVVLMELAQAHILAEVHLNASGTIGYQPASSIEKLTITKILQRLDHLGTDAVPVVECQTAARLREILAQFEALRDSSSANLRIQEL